MGQKRMVFESCSSVNGTLNTWCHTPTPIPGVGVHSTQPPQGTLPCSQLMAATLIHTTPTPTGYATLHSSHGGHTPTIPSHSQGLGFLPSMLEVWFHWSRGKPNSYLMERMTHNIHILLDHCSHHTVTSILDYTKDKCWFVKLNVRSRTWIL
jgi:hypothetical protein